MPDKPTKSQRINALEDEVAALRALVSTLQIQIARGCRPRTVGASQPWVPSIGPYVGGKRIDQAIWLGEDSTTHPPTQNYLTFGEH